VLANYHLGWLENPVELEGDILLYNCMQRWYTLLLIYLKKDFCVTPNTANTGIYVHPTSYGLFY